MTKHTSTQTAIKAITENDDIAGSYDALPYDSHAFAQAHPNHLRSVAALFGLNPPDLSHARVLEIGCAAGGNLWPMAYRYPKAQFVGIDLSPQQINDGQETVNNLGIKNLKLITGSVTEMASDIGMFDYIVCHGVYSWVPPEVQDAILSVCSSHLNPTGIAYVSYNTYPGWKGREIVRDAMLYRANKRGGDIHNQLNVAYGMVDFMAQHATAPLVKQNMTEMQTLFKTAARSYVGHDFLEIYNSPCYFSEFAARAAGKQLAYLSESEVHTIYAGNLPQHLQQQLLAECNGDQVVLEQYMDYLNNRSFRQTLLVHESQKSKINYNTPLATWMSLHYEGTYTLKAHAAPHTYTSRKGGFSTLPQPWHQAVAAALTAASPGTVSAQALLSTAKAQQASVTEAELCQMLFQQVQTASLRFSVTPIHAAPHLGNTGKLDPYVAAYSKNVTDEQKIGHFTNLWHEHCRFVAGYSQAIAEQLDQGSDADSLKARLAALGQDAQLLFKHALMQA